MRHICPGAVSIPRSGFWVFKLASSIVPIRWCARLVSIPRSGFWVFKRPSAQCSAWPACSFNPSVGILGVQARLSRWAIGYLLAVSIPRSGFWVFKLCMHHLWSDPNERFNPSVGILGVQAQPMPQNAHSLPGFQSLGRDSGCSSFCGCGAWFVKVVVSIPRSGFWVFKHHGRGIGQGPGSGFNPSVGILGVQAWQSQAVKVVYKSFQSLGRDSGCSSHLHRRAPGVIRDVSIPRSGFWVFKPAGRTIWGDHYNEFQSLGRDSGCSSCRQTPRRVLPQAVSIPRSGFWVFKP